MIVVLTIIAGAAALLIAVTNEKTKDRISSQQAAAQKEALQHIMPGGVTISEHTVTLPQEDESQVYWMGTSKNDTVYAFKIASRGYSSTIKYLVCVTAQGSITGSTISTRAVVSGLVGRAQTLLTAVRG